MCAIGVAGGGGGGEGQLPLPIAPPKMPKNTFLTLKMRQIYFSA